MLSQGDRSSNAFLPLILTAAVSAARRTTLPLHCCCIPYSSSELQKDHGSQQCEQVPPRREHFLSRFHALYQQHRCQHFQAGLTFALHSTQIVMDFFVALLHSNRSQFTTEQAGLTVKNTSAHTYSHSKNRVLANFSNFPR